MGEVPALDEFDSFLCAALLHDIGKLYQRAHPEIGGRHWVYSAEFVEAHAVSFPDPELVRTLVAHHHESPAYTEPSDRPESIDDPRARMLAYLISQADNLSASERDRSGQAGGYRAGVPLESVFAHVNIGCSSARDSDVRACYDLGIIPEASSYPRQMEQGYELSSSDYERHADSFRSKLQRLFPQPYPNMADTLLSLLEEFLWCVPSDTTRERVDISLADHSKVTCGLAACFYRFHEENGWNEKSVRDTKTCKVLLVCGDLSGIQDYIYGTASVGYGGVAKRLRGRSFRISLLSELIARRLLYEFRLPAACKIMSAGGQFYVLLPNTSGAQDKLAQFVRNMEEWLLKSYQGEITIATAWKELSSDDLAQGRFDEVLDEIYGRIAEAKLRKMENVLSEGKNLLEIHFQGRPACPVCDRRPASGDKEPAPCRECELDAALGRRLLSGKWLVISESCEPDRPDSVEFFEDPVWYAYVVDGIDDEHLKKTTPICCLNLRDSDLLVGIPSGFMFYSGYAPVWRDQEECDRYSKYLRTRQDEDEQESVEPGEVKTFSALAFASIGDNLLGILRADVDHLGLIFSLGLRGRASISRITTLSTMLNLFFSVELVRLIKEEFPDTYIAYAGGDDLMLVGPWDYMIRLSKRIADKFAEFTGHNPNLTLSAAIGTYKPRIPIATSSVQTGELLERSKSAGRNRLTVFDTTIPWEDFELLEQWAAMLINSLNLESGGISKAFLYRLFNYHQQAQRYFETGDVRSLMFRPHLAYDIGRNYTDDSGNPLLADRNLYDMLCSLLETGEEVKRSWRILKAAITWSSYATRKRESATQ